MVAASPHFTPPAGEMKGALLFHLSFAPTHFQSLENSSSLIRYPMWKTLLTPTWNMTARESVSAAAHNLILRFVSQTLKQTPVVLQDTLLSFHPKAQGSSHWFRTIYSVLAVDLCAKWPLLCEAILLCHLINMAAICIIAGRDHGDHRTFTTRADQYSGMSIHSNATSFNCYLT